MLSRNLKKFLPNTCKFKPQSFPDGLFWLGPSGEGASFPAEVRDYITIGTPNSIADEVSGKTLEGFRWTRSKHTEIVNAETELHNRNPKF